MPKDKNGILGTIFFHNILLLILIFFGFTNPKPLPGIEGIKIDFGNEETGSGISELENEVKTAESIPEKVPDITTDSKEDIITQDFEEAPKVVKKKTEVKKKKNIEKPVKPEEKPVEKPKQVNTKALYKGKTTTSESNNSEGDDNVYGNKGDINGDKNSDNYSYGSSYGSGVSFSLAGRNGISLPKPELKYQKQGKVVVEITVDRQGNVVNATSGVKGSTTLDTYLLNAAKKAAVKSKFTAKPNAPFHQKGYITYHFKLQ